MAKPLTAAEAYLAGRADFAAADILADEANINSQQVFIRTLARLWQERIDRGELPPLLEKAS